MLFFFSVVRPCLSLSSIFYFKENKSGVFALWRMSQDSLLYVDENEMWSLWYSLSHYWYEGNHCRCYLVNNNFNPHPPISFTLIVLNRLSCEICGLWNYHSLCSHNVSGLTQAALEWWVIYVDQMILCHKEAWKHSSLTCHSNGMSAVCPSLCHFLCICMQFDFVELLDGRRLLVQDTHGLEGPVGMQRSLVPITTHDTGFIQYMDSGIWHLAIYNDGKETETVSFLTTAIGEHCGHNLQ